MTKDINIVITTDPLYSLGAVATLRSALLHLKYGHRIVCRVFVEAAHRNSVNRLLLLEREFPTLLQLEIVEAGDVAEKFRDRGYLKKSTYFRYAAADRFIDWDYALYLDVDTIVFRDLSETLDIIPFSEPIAAVGRKYEDGYFKANFPEGFRDGSPWPRESDCFNAGVLVMNLNLMRKMNLLDAMVELSARFGQFAQMADQDFLNALICNRWKRLDESWNLRISCIENRVSFMPTFPAIVHAVGPIKPWHTQIVTRVGVEGYFRRLTNESANADPMRSRPSNLHLFYHWLRFLLGQIRHRKIRLFDMTILLWRSARRGECGSFLGL